MSSRDQALAFAEIALAVAEVLEQYVDLPSSFDFIDPVDEDAATDAIARVAANARAMLGLGPGPASHVVRLLDARGTVVLRLPSKVAPRVDAFSTDAGKRPLVLQRGDDHRRPRTSIAPHPRPDRRGRRGRQ